MADAVAEKTKIKDDEFDIHGDLAVSEAEDKSFVVLYDSSQENSEADSESAARSPAPVLLPDDISAPTLEDIDENHAMAPTPEVHPEDAYIDDILSSDDIDTHEVAPAAAPLQAEHHDDEGPIALSSEELDGILEMGPATEEEFHPDFPVEQDAPVMESAPVSPEDEEPLYLAESEPSFDDDELPIALSDEDLDEILLEEEAGAPPPPAARAPSAQAEPPIAATPAAAAPPAAAASDPFALTDDDEEPIALSDDELDNILADAEAGHSHGDGGAPELLPEGNEDELLTLDDDPEITMIDDGAAEFHGDTAHSSAPSNDADSFFDSDEDEPITLSDEELDGILSTAPEEDAPQMSDEVALTDLPAENSAIGAANLEVEDEEPIALSNEELDGILMDATEVAEDDHDSAAAPDGNAGFFDGDEDEPIALSADELDGIAATAVPDESHTEEASLADLPPDAESSDEALSDERYADIDGMDAGTDENAGDAEDDGPIALSTDELDGIVADSREVTPEAPMMPLSHMDTGADEPSLADNVDKPATVFEEDLEQATLIHEDDQAAAPAAPAPDAEELKSVMTYLDNLLGELPDDVIEKFAQSEYFKLYQKIMDKLGL